MEILHSAVAILGAILLIIRFKVDPVISLLLACVYLGLAIGLGAKGDRVALLARRFGYMAAAARIKPTREAVRDERRKAEVIANARASAEASGLPAGAVADLWERLVEASIAYELDAFDRR